jgi:poly-gamma-glutamate synthesis protein (capsule biosynthesis protein)
MCHDDGMRRLLSLAFVVVVVVVAGCAKKPAADVPLVFSPEKTRTRLLFVGDTSVARDVARAIKDHGGDDPRWTFAPMKPVLDAADVVFANLECVVSDSGSEEATSKTFRIRAEPRYAEHLKESGIDVVSVANNHAMDFGRQGFASTLDVLQQQGIAAVGVRVDAVVEQRPVVVKIGDTRVGFLAYNQHGDEYKHADFDRQAFGYAVNRVVADVKAARARNDADVIVVSVHGGPELSYLPDPWQRADARQVLDAGADVWMGHHPHVVQPVEEYKGKLIVYSLGDFVFDKRSEWIRDRTSPRFFVGLDLAGGKVVGHEILAGVHDRDYRPSLAPEFPLAPWTSSPPARSAVLSEQLDRARVERVRDGVAAACTPNKSRPDTGGHELRWLRPRLACANDKARPWQTVARSGELSNREFRAGVWAPPHAGGPLTITWPGVTLGATLEGFAGVPDWGIALMQQRKNTSPKPIRLRVRIPDVGVDHEVIAPVEPGWRAFVVDTKAAAGQKHDVIVDVDGGDGDVEQRFLFDLWAP